MNHHTIKQHAHTVRLSGLLESLELRLQEAEANRFPYAQFLELLLQDEINVRHQRLLSRRQKLADFREVRSLDNFDFSFNPGINRAQIYELARRSRYGTRPINKKSQHLHHTRFIETKIAWPTVERLTDNDMILHVDLQTPGAS